MRRRGITLVALLSTVVAVPAHAQTSVKDFFNYCTSTSIRTCASVRVETTWDIVAKLNRVKLLIQNLEGWYSLENSGGGPITRIGLTAPSLKNLKSFKVTTEGTVGQVNAPSQKWAVTNWPIGDPGPVVFSAVTTKAPEGGIFGCHLLNKGQPSSYFSTCGSNAGFVAFSFTTTNQWDASQAQVAWKLSSANADGQNHICRTADVAPSYYTCGPTQVSVTPEPASMALLGSGLLGLGGLKRRRKKPEAAAV